MGANRKLISVAVALCLLGGLVGISSAGAAPPGRSRADQVRAHWTEARIAAAIPRDFVVDPQVTATPLRAATPAAKPPSSGDSTGPTITDLDPAQGAEITAPYTFQAQVTDASLVKSVTFDFYGNAGTTLVSSFAATNTGGDTWAVQIGSITDGEWAWEVRATDGAKRGGNSNASGKVFFTVGTTTTEPPPPPADDEIVTNARYTGGGPIQTAAGRIYFEMRSSSRGPARYVGYVCSGTVARDEGIAGRSLIITAAHCVYDDVNKEFARHVLFIPNQDQTTGAGTDTNCGNDPLGCWAPAWGVVDNDWASRQWPANIPWDHAFYVATDSSHTGTGTHTALDVAAKDLAVQFSSPTQGALTTALGYSYSDDPYFMHCREALSNDGGNLWLPNCGLSGGASGGPWVQPLTSGDGPIVSVNSYGYSNQPGMGASHLGPSTRCLFDAAKAVTNSTVPTNC